MEPLTEIKVNKREEGRRREREGWREGGGGRGREREGEGRREGGREEGRGRDRGREGERGREVGRGNEGRESECIILLIFLS